MAHASPRLLPVRRSGPPRRSYPKPCASIPQPSLASVEGPMNGAELYCMPQSGLRGHSLTDISRPTNKLVVVLGDCALLDIDPAQCLCSLQFRGAPVWARPNAFTR